MKKTQSRKTKILHNERERVWKDALTYSHHLKRRKDILSIISRSFKSFKSKLVLKSDAEFFTRVKREKPSETARSELAYLSPKITKLEQSLWSEIHVLVTKNKLGSISCALFWRFRGFLSDIGPEFPRSFERRGFYRCDETARSYQIFVVYSRRTTEMSSSDKYATRFLLLCAFFHRKSTAESHFNFFSSATFLVFLVLKSIQQHSKEEEAIRISLRIANFTQQCSSYWWSYRTNESTFEKSNLALAFLFLVRTFLSGLRMSILRLKTRQFNLKSNAIQSKEKKNCSSWSSLFFFLSVLVTHSAKNSLFKHEKKFLLLLLFSWIVKQPFPPKRKKKLRVFHRRKNQSRALENQNLTHASPALTPFLRSVPSFICFLVHVPGVGAKFMSGFFSFLCLFLASFSLFEKKLLFLSFFSFFFFSFFFFSRNSLFWGWEKEEKKYISRKKRAFSFREREEYSHHHLRSRGTEGKETLAVITSCFSLFVVVVVRFAAGNKVCH